MFKSNYATTTEKLLYIPTGLNLISSHSPILRSTQIISLTRNHLLHNLCKMMSTPCLMMTKITRNTFYCLTSWRLLILHLPLQLINHRSKFLLVNVLAICQLLLPSRNQVYLTTHPQLCALAHAHTQVRLHTSPPPSRASSCRRSRLSRCLFFKGGGRDWKLTTK
jgi:hypothetical protein